MAQVGQTRSGLIEAALVVAAGIAVMAFAVGGVGRFRSGRVGAA